MSIFSEISQSIWMKFSLLPQPDSLLKLMPNWFCIRNNRGRELCWHDFVKYTINSVVCWDTCEPVCLKLGVMLDSTKLFSLNDLDINVHSRVTGSQESWSLCSHSVEKLREAAQMFMLVDCENWGGNREEVLYGKDRLFEHSPLFFKLWVGRKELECFWY